MIHLFHAVPKECKEALKSPNFQSKMCSFAVEMRKTSVLCLKITENGQELAEWGESGDMT